MSKPLLVYSLPNEPITEIFLNKYSDGDAVSIAELLEKGEIFDQFDEKEVAIQWTLPGKAPISNQQDWHLINRVCHIPEDWFSDFHEDDRAYAQTEFWSYLTFALNSFPKSTGKPGEGSFYGDSLSLPKQWKWVENLSLSIGVPEFFIGPLDSLPSYWGEDAIFSEPYNYYFWKPKPCPKEKADNVFAIRRPLGDPIVVFCMGEDTHVFLEKDQCLSSGVEKNLLSVAETIHETFDFFCSEMLFFVCDEGITFGMIHNTPWASKRSPDFQTIVEKNLEKLLEKPF